MPATEKCWNCGQIVERTYDWSHRSWVIVKGANQSQQGRWSRSKIVTCDSKSQAVARLAGQLVVPPDDWWCHPSYDVTFDSAITHDLSRLVARPYDRWYTNRLLPDTRNCGDVSGVQVTPHTTPDAMAGVPDMSQNPTIDRIRSIAERDD